VKPGWLGQLEVAATLLAGTELAVAFVAWELPFVYDGADALLPLSASLGQRGELLALRVDETVPCSLWRSPATAQATDRWLPAAPAPWTATLFLVAQSQAPWSTGLASVYSLSFGLLAEASRDDLDRADRQARPPLPRARRVADRRWLLVARWLSLLPRTPSSARSQPMRSAKASGTFSICASSVGVVGRDPRLGVCRSEASVPLRRSAAGCLGDQRGRGLALIGLSLA